MILDRSDQFFYQIYPLGLCGAPQQNDMATPSVARLDALHAWATHVQDLGATSVYLGPVFESGTHGYDSADYFKVDRRLGDDAALARCVAAFHERGMRVLLDGVFHHVGRDFWAFRDLQAHGENSRYRDWFSNVRFGARSPYGDQFSYDGWNGHASLVKLNLTNHEVKMHLFDAVAHWVRAFDIDGLRIDAADYIDRSFLAELAQHCRSLRPDFWLLGEVIHGDYRNWANPDMFDSVTNYQAYKGLYSSHNDRNYFEIAYTLNQQFGPSGIYAGLPLYAFADNHDVDRIASVLRNPAHLYPLHALLFTMPGVPSIYYGSEWGIAGAKHNGDDTPLRPALDLNTISYTNPHPDLAATIVRLARLRHASAALRRGSYQQLFVANEQLAFARATAEECVIVAVNAADAATTIEMAVPHGGQRLVDILNDNATYPIDNGRAQIDVSPTWARVLQVV